VRGVTILIADDHPLFRDALRLAVLRAAPEAAIVEAGTLAAAIDALHQGPPASLVLLDLKMSDCEGFAGLAQLHAESPGTPILVVSGVDQGKGMRGAQEFGAVGFVSKSAGLDTIAAAIRSALEGRNAFANGAPAGDAALDDMTRKVASLTPAQLKVLLGILRGRLNKQIAYELQISEGTVKAHVTALMRKLDVQSRTQAALAARALALDFETAFS
jgi:DNA-binding NarL/FixJ family response regulator